MSIPANPKKMTISLSDGVELQVKKLGDESFHYYQTEKGICYVKYKDRYIEFEPSVLKVNYEVERSKRNINKVSFPTSGTHKSLVILVEFSDLSFSIENPDVAFFNLFNEKGYSDNGATGSVRDYFYENSQGDFSVDFEVVGPIKLDKPMKYYGENDSSLPFQNKDIRAQEVIVDACKAADKYVDYSEYDYNNDGLVDNVFVVYCGYSEADGGVEDCIWPHEWNLIDAGINLVLDGKQISSYACSNELKDGNGELMVGIGTFCHEFGHVLGLPDLYTTNSSTSFTPGPWSVMDVGSYNNDGRTPPYLSSYERLSLGWILPEKLPINNEDVCLLSIDNNNSYILETDNANEYFLFENRQLTGWDKYLPGHGMLVWHIDYNKNIWDMSAINNDYKHQHVDILEADNNLTSYSRDGDTFPGVNGITSINDNTVPGLISWTGVPSCVDIYDIKENNNLICFKTREVNSNIDSPVIKSATNITPTSFVARWNKSSEDLNYEIIVVEVLSDETLSGYDWKNVGNVDSAHVVMLNPLTEYYYKVRAKNGIYYSDESDSVLVSTPDYTFEFLSPKVLPPKDVTNNSFIACWEAFDGTENYYLNIYNKAEVGQEYKENDFSNNLIMPSGWSTNCSKTNGIEGFYGKAAPSLRFDKDGQYLMTPFSSNYYRSLCFWYRPSLFNDDNIIYVEGQKSGEWIPIDTINLLESNQESQLYENNELPDSINVIRISYSGDQGALMIDDVVAGFAYYDWCIIEDYDNIDVGNNIEYEVTGLLKGKEYQYSVRAWNGTVSSLWSDRMDVITITGINDSLLFTPDYIDVYLDLSEVRILNKSNCKRVCCIYDISGTELYSFTLVPGGYNFCYLNPGIYIIACDNFVKKVIVK